MEGACNRRPKGRFSFVTAPEEKANILTKMLAQKMFKSRSKVDIYGRFDLKIGTGLKYYGVGEKLQKLPRRPVS